MLSLLLSEESAQVQSKQRGLPGDNMTDTSDWLFFMNLLPNLAAFGWNKSFFRVISCHRFMNVVNGCVLFLCVVRWIERDDNASFYTTWWCRTYARISCQGELFQCDNDCLLINTWIRWCQSSAVSIASLFDLSIKSFMLEWCDSNTIAFIERDDYQNCSVLYSVWAVLDVDCSFSFSLHTGLLFVFLSFCSCVVCFCCVRFSFF